MRRDIMPPIERMFVISQQIVEIQNPKKEQEKRLHTIKGTPQNTEDYAKSILECHLRHYLRKLIKH